MGDPVNHPPHYLAHPSGIECIEVTEHMTFPLGSAIKYIWRADHKGGVDDLRKAVWYLTREIARRHALDPPPRAEEHPPPGGTSNTTPTPSTGAAHD
jgi:Protein of unknwon function (DUF3310)